MAPYVGLSPTIPHRAAGWRIEPPVSVPIAHGAVPAATAAAEPPDDPPGTREVSQGLRTGPYAEFSIFEPAWLGIPFVQKRSLIAIGTPPSGASRGTSGGSPSGATHVNALRSSAT